MSKSKVFLGIGVGLGVLGAVAGTLAAVNKVKKSKEVEEEVTADELVPSDEFPCIFAECDCESCNCYLGGFDEVSPFSVEETKEVPDASPGDLSILFEAEEAEEVKDDEVVEEVKPKRRSKSKEKDVEEDGETI